MQIARRLNARKYFFNKSHCQLPEDACFALSFATQRLFAQAARCIRALSRHPEARAQRASKDGPRAVLILRGAQERAPQDDGSARGLPEGVNRLAPAGDAEKP